MTTKQHRCTSCGFRLETPQATLCLPCLVADAKSKMLVGLSQCEPNGGATYIKAAIDTRWQQALASHNSENVPAKRKKSKKEKKVKLESVRINRRKNQESSRLASGLVCVLCGNRVAPGELLTHKETVHGEKRFSQPGAINTSGKHLWVSVFQGGLPGLGKRR